MGCLTTKVPQAMTYEVYIKMCCSGWWP